MTLPDKPTVNDQEDRDLLANEEIQKRWSDVSVGLGENAIPLRGNISDDKNRCFKILATNEELKPGQNLDNDDALSRGYTHIIYFGAINKDDGLCYSQFGLYFSENKDVMIDASIETDMNNRKLGIARQLYETALETVNKMEKTFEPSGRYTKNGLGFAQALQK